MGEPVKPFTTPIPMLRAALAASFIVFTAHARIAFGSLRSAFGAKAAWRAS